MKPIDDDQGLPLAQPVLDTLLAGINAGKYQPGQRIIATDLCEQLGVSLAPVREALHVLAGQNVVELHRNRGAVLCPLSHQDIIDFWTVIAAPISLSVRLAAGKIHKADNAERVIKNMQQIAERARQATLFDSYIKVNEYHYLLNEISENPFLESLFNRYFIAYWERFLANALQDNYDVEEYIHNYQRLTDSILCGDAQTAESAWNYHVGWTTAVLCRQAQEKASTE